MRNLILTGGMYHPFEDSAETLSRLLDSAGFTSTVTFDMEHGFDLLASGVYELLTVYALRWTMPQEKFASDRAAWAYSPSLAARAALKAHRTAGKGILALHTAAICFDDWPEWHEAVGASWRWGHSFHPPYGGVQVRPTGQVHPIVGDTPAFALADEAYTQMVLDPGLEPLMEVRADVQSDYSPCLWARETGRSRFVFDSLGHDSASLLQTQHKGIVQRAALWATHRLD